MLKNLKIIIMGWVLPPPPLHIVDNNVIYVFCEKLKHLENK